MELLKLLLEDCEPVEDGALVEPEILFSPKSAEVDRLFTELLKANTEAAPTTPINLIKARRCEKARC